MSLSETPIRLSTSSFRCTYSHLKGDNEYDLDSSFIDTESCEINSDADYNPTNESIEAAKEETSQSENIGGTRIDSESLSLTEIHQQMIKSMQKEIKRLQTMVIKLDHARINFEQQMVEMKRKLVNVQDDNKNKEIDYFADTSDDIFNQINY